MEQYRDQNNEQVLSNNVNNLLYQKKKDKQINKIIERGNNL